jgi:predicted oxidoreductase
LVTGRVAGVGGGVAMKAPRKKYNALETTFISGKLLSTNRADPITGRTCRIPEWT